MWQHWNMCRREFHSCCLFPINEGLCSFMLLLIVVKKIIPLQASSAQGQNNWQFREQKNSLKPCVWEWTCNIKEFLLDKFEMGQRHRKEREHVCLCYHVIPNFVIRPLKETKTDFSVPILHYLCFLIKGSNFAVSGPISFECSSTILYTNFIVNVAREGGSGLKAWGQSSNPNSLWKVKCKLSLWPSGVTDLTIIHTYFPGIF